MKKIGISTSLKRGLIGLVGIGTLGLGIASYVCATQREEVTRNRQLYQYEISSNSTYQVSVKDNPLYATGILEEGQSYVASFVKGIEARFETFIVSDETVAIVGEYSLDAYLVSMNSEGEEVWRKRYALEGPKRFQYTGEQYEFQVKTVLDYSQYQGFVKEMQELTGINHPVELQLLLNGEVQLETPYGTVIRPLEGQLMMPIVEEAFKITKGSDAFIQDGISEPYIEVVKIKDPKAIGFGLSALVGGLLTGWLIIGTESLTTTSLKRRMIRRFFRRYERRLIGLEQLSKRGYTKEHLVGSLEDLVKLSEQLKVPMLYCNQRDVLKIEQLHVAYQDTLYTYTLFASERVKPPLQQASYSPVLEWASEPFNQK